MNKSNIVFIALSLYGITVAQGSPVSFQEGKIEMPPLSLTDLANHKLEAMRQAVFASPGNLPVQPVEVTSFAITVIPPCRDVDYKLHVIAPDPSVDYKLTIVDPGKGTAK